ncbi:MULTISPECIES: alanine racemase [Leptolyngbya]|uniref:Alanine racemase n=1 Tax=Leptolyngbya boryana CZ1 TaxID=3060204 RepID=A0AA96X0J6_LEPBY|nr:MULTISPECIES: alanine racemase [Leptolyngbya]MCY6488564.1 alanine racemase [Leptolyngbya sp. GGD]WNZ48822.1 alanine racemase [Leptolyngbya boryana CZ1]
MLSWDQSSSIALMQRERAWVEIDLAALSHNVQQILSLMSPQTELMAVVKADAYGHGSVTVAQTVLQAGASWLGVATIPEGIELREAGIEAPILVLGATHTADQIRAIEHWRLQPTLCTPKQALVYSESVRGSVLPVHIKLDTGMSRLGTSWEQAVEFVQLVKGLPNLSIDSIYSHLATAEDLDPTIRKQQQKRYEAAIRACGYDVAGKHPRFHLANSAGTMVDPSLHYDMVRTGLILYGLYPAEHLRSGSHLPPASRLDLRPVMQVKARVTQVKRIQPGTGVSYGHRFVADRDTTIAVVGIGYADGVPRNLSNKMKVLVRGQQAAQIGSITMDQLMLDVSHIPALQEGEVVTLLGQDGNEKILADDWANLLGTISWEILCGFKHRLPRVSVGQPYVAKRAVFDPIKRTLG